MSVSLSIKDAISSFDTLAGSIKGSPSSSDIQALRNSREMIRMAYNKAIAVETSEPAKKLEAEKACVMDSTREKIESLNKFKGENILGAIQILADPTLDKTTKEEILDSLRS